MNKTLASLMVAVLFAAPASALEWQNIGPRALGMEGAGVAMPQGPLNEYWNPAGIGMRGNTSGLIDPVHVHAALSGNILEGANDLNKIANNPTAYTATDVTRALNKINQPGSGLRVDAAIAPAVKIKKVVVFTNVLAHMGAVPLADFSVTNPALLSNPSAAIRNNSKLTIKGIQLAEFGVGYGQELPFAPGVLLGGNLKLMKGQVGYFDYLVASNDSANNDLFKKLKDGAKSSTNFGVDLGALWDMDRTFTNLPMRPRLGLVGRNLNNPKFSQPAAATEAGLTNKFAVNPQVRMGLAVSPLNWWHLAADLDMTKNTTPLDGRPSRQLSLGTEVDVFNRSWINVPLRAGILRNVADNSKTMLTLGGGLNFLHVHTDASLAWSPKKITTQSEGGSKTFPAEVAGGVSLSLLFGGGEEGAEKAAPTPAPQAAPAAPAVQPGAKADDQPVPTEKVREAAEKAHKDLDAESKKTP